MTQPSSQDVSTPASSQDVSTPASSPSSNSTAKESESPFTFVETKTESNGFHNTMELYAITDKFNLEAFRQFCKLNKSKASAEAFTYIVLFDDARNAAFPNSPFTAVYGLEEDKIKHIVAIFIYNRINGFCEMSVYDPNMWEGTAKTEKL